MSSIGECDKGPPGSSGRLCARNVSRLAVGRRILKSVRGSEILALAYFAYLFVTIGLRRVYGRRRLSTGLAALALVGLVWLVSRLGAPWQLARDWAPGFYMLAGYWLPGRL